jgi:hypothetical protein
MATQISKTREQRFCSKTMQSETVIIRHTTVSTTSRGIDGERVDSHTRRNIDECTGLETCGVKTTHGNSETFDWDLCPVLQTLNTP